MSWGNAKILADRICGFHQINLLTVWEVKSEFVGLKRIIVDYNSKIKSRLFFKQQISIQIPPGSRYLGGSGKSLPEAYGMDLTRSWINIHL